MRLFNGDCLNELQHLPDASIDLIIADPPYGITNCEWDKVIPLEPMWKELHRVAKDSAAILIFAIDIFESDLRVSNRDNYRYEIVIEKNTQQGFLMRTNDHCVHMKIFLCFIGNNLHTTRKKQMDI
ncbi:hypothetical protein [Snodgrassella sp. W8158]|uniref:hypothetical protein n=1 Tax=Snodgrassella sp. W8158 TaxID=2751018 RepID=UPI0018DDBC0B|nr:hypothetical protein [Snodgrassella sp. W8158]